MIPLYACHRIYRQAALLLHHFMRVTFYNSHETTEVEKIGPNWSDNSLQKIGRATNPTLALINHGCDPNYDRVSWGRITLGFACKPIAAGEEIVDTYCQPFVVVAKEERRQRLAKYNFSCACNACKHNWPRMNGLEERVQRRRTMSNGYISKSQITKRNRGFCTNNCVVSSQMAQSFCPRLQIRKYLRHMIVK